MGAGMSSSDSGPEGVSGGPTGLGTLPEGCVAEIMLRLEPAEICRLARLCRTFCGAASADLVWETKLPRNYRYLLGKASGVDNSEGRRLSKKEIFALLCRRNALGGANMVRGEVEFCFPEGTYSLYFRLHLGRATKRLGRRVCSPEHVHGWDVKPVRFTLSTSDGQLAQSKCYLDEPGSWIHYHVGDFVSRSSDAPTGVKFSMTQIDCTHTKGGLCVDSVLIWPQGFVGPPTASCSFL
ncbi:hypothetical protein BHE74_00000435 [Ensete ventricosum]|nr:hypothetical protein BHE74_00000435 [Ensete ventricosum]